MEKSKKDTYAYSQILSKARMELMRSHPFYAILLMHVSFGLDEYTDTAYTDGSMIVFSPQFIDQLSSQELQFILMHEVMHIALNHCNRKLNEFDNLLFNVACDIVVNSNILFSFNQDISTITLKQFGESMHLTPDGKEGCEFTVEEVYKLLLEEKEKKKGKTNSNKDKNKEDKNTDSKENDANIEENNEELLENIGFDDHSYWGNDGNQEIREEWKSILIQAKRAQDKFEEVTQSSGSVPSLLQREIDEYTKPQTNWKELLQNFIQVDIVDYSFNPPDRRMQESSLILPDFNYKDEEIKNVWFVIDTSGSISKEALTIALSEIKGAIDQFNGKLEAYISYFDKDITKPVKFKSLKEFEKAELLGGGGTSFDIIFEKINTFFLEDPPSSIVVLTDGEADFPEEKVRKNIPVLWLINNDLVTPPWGIVGRIKVDERF